jgi:tRNA pseudouridine55 synthase
MSSIASRSSPGRGVRTDGVLVIDKPSGPTSFDIVRQVRRALGTRRAGHGGTLDPLASGVLPICLGEATKLAQFLLDADKEYEATLCFGVETDTYDAAGAVTERRSADGLTAAAVESALGAFRGPIRQVPPRFSALKLRGRPLYAYARAGEEVEIAPRTVVVHEIALARWVDATAVVLSVRCSKGTYIRSLAFDLGRALGPGAHLTALRRTRSGPFRIGEAYPPGEIETAPLIGLSEALAHLPALRAGAAVAQDLQQGKRVGWAALEPSEGPIPGRFRVLRSDGTLLAVAQLGNGVGDGDGSGDRVADGAGRDDRVRTLRVFN